MAIGNTNESLIQKKIDDIQTLIKHTDKNSKLRDKLESQFTSLLEEQERLRKTTVTPSNAASVRKQVEEFQSGLDTFKKWLVKKISTSPVFKSPVVEIQRLSKKEVLKSQGNRNGYDSDEENNSEEDDLFLRVDRNTDVNVADLREKRIRKPVEHPDFVRTPLSKKQRIETEIELEPEEEEDMMEDDDMQDISSAEDSQSSPFKTNGFSQGKSGGGPEFPCPVCRKIFRKKGHMTRHLLTHEPEKPFGCDFCSKRFAAKYSLQMHLLNRHNTDAKPFECEVCDRRFTLKKELDCHVQSHKDGFKPKSFQCTHCDLKFITQGDLDNHIQGSHPDADCYNCGKCDKTFPRKYNLIRHEKTHSGEKQYHCGVCNKDFGTKNGLQMHLQSHEQDNKEEKPLACHICGKKFSVEQNLEIHIAYHTQAEEKPYSCDLCEVRFKTQERLEKHIETHGSSEGRVYPCQYCEKTFPRKYNLIRHELSHTHGRRKPKEGMPTPIPRILEQRERTKEFHVHHTAPTTRSSTASQNHASNSGATSTDDEAESATVTGSYTDEYLTIIHPAEHKNYNYVYQTISKSEIYASLFGRDDDDSYDGIAPPFSKQKYRILKFENY